MSSRPSEDDGRVVARPDERSLVLEGDVDMSAVEAFDRSGGDDLSWVRTIDVSAVTFVDTQGLGLMLRVAAPRGRAAPSERPALLGASPQVQQLLEMLGVESLFDVRAAHDGAAHDGAAHDGVAHDGAVHDGAVHDGAALDGVARDGAGDPGAAPPADGSRPTP